MHATDQPTPATRPKVVLRRRGGTSYVAGVDHDFGGVTTTTERHAALVFADIDAARTFAKSQGLAPTEWKMLAR